MMKLKTAVRVIPSAFWFVPLMVLLVTPSASALSLTYAFCSASSDAGEASSCIQGLGAALRITDELPGLDPTDPNDFYVLLATDTRASGGFNTTTTTGIDAVQFDTPYDTRDFESAPTLDESLVSGGLDWSVFFGQINHCPTGNPNDKSVCSSVVGGGSTNTGDIDIWAFKINLVDTIVTPFTANSAMNMRVSFLPHGNLSPGVEKVLPPGTPTPFDEEPVSAPEPGSLLLLGSGLALAARRFRQKKTA